VGGVIGGMMNQAIQQQQQQQFYQRQQQQQQYYQQQQQQNYLQQQQNYQQTLQLRAQQQHQEAERQRQRAAGWATRQEQARARAEANNRQHLEAAQAAEEAKAKADQEAQVKAAAEVRLQAEAFEERKEEIQALKRKLDVGKDDITVFIVSHDTKRVVRNLAGDPQFVSPADGCYPFKYINENPSTSGGRFLSDTLEKIKKKGGGSLKMDKCTAKTFGDYDLLVFTPEQLDLETNPTIKPDDVRSILDAVNERHFTQFSIYTKASYEAELQQRSEAIAEDEKLRAANKWKIEAEFKKINDDTIAAIYLKAPASRVCLGGPSRSGVKNLLEQTDHKFADLVTKKSALLEMGDANLIFLSIKKQECFAVVAPKGMLLDVIIPALQRDNVHFDYHPDTISAPEAKALASLR
jgi:hypothetical protein